MFFSPIGYTTFESNDINTEMKTEVSQDSDAANPELLNGGVLLTTELLPDEQNNINDFCSKNLVIS